MRTSPWVAVALTALLPALAALPAAHGEDGAEEEAPAPAPAPEPAPQPALRVGDEAPPVTAATWLNTEAGASPFPDAARGKVVMVEFWGTWCGPCVRSMPHVQELHDRYGSRGLLVVGITREDAGPVRPFLAENRYTFPIGCDPEKACVSAYRPNGWPSTFVLDREGRIAYVGNPYGAEAAVERALGLEVGPGALLTAHLDLPKSADPAERRAALLRLVEKAPASFDLRAWARAALGAEPPEAPAPQRLDAAKALDALAPLWTAPDATKRTAALTALARAAPEAFDLRAWARATFAKAHPLTRDEVRAELEAGRHGPLLDALLDRNPSAALLAAAAKDAAFVGWCRAKREDRRKDARRALMAIHYVFVEKPMDGMDEKAQERFWADLSVSGVSFDEEKKRILGLLIGGRRVMSPEAATYAREELSRFVLMTSVLDGKPLKPAAAAAEAAKEEAEIVKDLRRTYGP